MRTIYFLCPDQNSPVGGIRVIYRMVDTLNKHGIPASVLHTKSGFRCTWFENSTRVETYNNSLSSRARVIVLPEIYGYGSETKVKVRTRNRLNIRANVEVRVGGIPKVIMNQNAAYSFTNHAINEYDYSTPYLSKEVIGTIVVSENDRKLLASIFPELRIHRIHLGINTDIFYPDESKKEKVIAFMTRKNYDDILYMTQALKFRGALNNSWVYTEIANKNEYEVANILRRSSLFVTVGSKEGFGLPPAEAMACGCICVGYHGYGGSEFMLDDFSFPVETFNTLALTNTVARIIKEYDDNPSRLKDMADKAVKFVSSNYTPEREENDMLSAWESLLSGV
jgi:glycosyltransferase involved in cell wall biosynthesis